MNARLLPFLSLALLAFPDSGLAQWSDGGSYIYPDNAPTVVITDTARVGIGVTNPSDKLHVQGTARFAIGEGLLLGSDTNYWGSNYDARLFRMIDGNGTNGNVDGGIVFESYTNPDSIRLPVFTLRHASNLTRVGIGSGFPLNLLTVNGSWAIGSGMLDSVGSSVFGTGTAFLSELEIGAEIVVDGYARQVNNIVSDTELTLNTAFPSNLVAASYRLNLPLFTVTDEGLVGIGTVSPTAALDVNGAIAVAGTTVIDAAGNWAGPVQGVDLTTDQTIGGDKTFTRRIHAAGGILSSDTLQIGDSTTGDLIDLYTTGRAMNFNRVGGSRFGEISTNSANDFIIQAPAAGAKLRSASDLYLRFSDTASWRGLYAGDVNAYSRLALLDSQSVVRGRFELSGLDTMFHNSQAGDFQVRTKLHVTGRNDSYLTFGTTNSSNIFFEGGTLAKDLNLRLGSTNDGKLSVAGDVEISRTLRVNSDLNLYQNLILHPLPTGTSSGQVCYFTTSSGDILVRCSSSARFKNDVEPLAPGLDIVAKLRPVTYEWTENGERDLGFIAEEVAAIEPLLATYGEEGVDGVKYDRLTAVLVHAIQQQQAQIEALKTLICADHPGAEVCR